MSVPAHSVRAIASSTAAATGIPINEILRAGGWTRESTFTKFYKKEMDGKQFSSYLEGIN